MIMRKTLLFISLVLAPFFSITTNAQSVASGVPSIKVVTSGKQDEGKLLSFSIYTKEKGFYVDFGNGNTRNYPWSGNVSFSDKTYGDSIKIYANSDDDPIQTFSCKDDSLTSVVINAPALTILDCSGNLLSSLDLSGAPALQKVVASKNNLLKFQFSEGTELTYLDVSQNKLEVIDVSNSNKLEYLNASVNNMRAPLSLKWSTGNAMKHFDISCNNFFNLNDIPSYPELEYFAFNHNKISSVDLSKYPKLKTLKMQYNTSIKTLDLSQNKDLEYLDITGTWIAKLNLQPCKHLQFLKASLVGLDGIDLSSVPELRSLNVEKCGLESLDLSANTQLVDVNVAGNNLKALDLSKNAELTNVNCSSNSITTLELSSLVKLDTLNCSINDISVLNLANNRSLTTLNCSSNSIDELDLKANKLLKYVNCADNQLPELTLSSQLNLVGGSVSSNAMDKAALENLFASLPDINGLDIEPENALWKGVLTYSNNPGTETADATALTAKGWKSQVSSDVLGDASAMLVFSPDLVGTKVSFAIDSPGDMMIDWGDGKKVFYKYVEKNGSYQNMEGVLQSTTMKIYAPEAVDLGVANASISQINVSNMSKLKHFSCSGNAITDLDVSKNEALEQLTCGNNPLVYLNLGEAQSLKQLYCENTQIKTFDFSKSKSLSYLDLQKNRLNSLDVSGCENLVTLDVTYNNLSYVDVSHSPKLTTFFADKNQLTKVDFTNNPLLQNLSVGFNQLETLDISKLKDLVYVYCNDNKLKELKPVSSAMVMLQAQNNQIGDIDLSKCPSLTIVAFNNNQLTSANLSACSLLQNLWLNDNQLSTIQTPKGGMPKLEVFNLSNNQFETFDFSIVPSVTELVISGNKFEGDIDLSQNKSLEKFFAYDNQIGNITFSNSGLTTLSVSNNQLKSLNVPSSDLYWVEANNNQLMGVNVSATTNLYLLHLDNNKLNSLNLDGKNILVSLSIRNNQFESNSLDKLYGQLPDLSDVGVSSENSSWMKWVFVEGNPGANDADYTILTNKGWNVDIQGYTSVGKVISGNPVVVYDPSTDDVVFSNLSVLCARITALSGISRNVDVQNGRVSLGELPKGIYIISVNVDGKTYTQKIVK